MKCQKTTNHSFTEPKVTSSDFLFCPANSAKHQDIQLTTREAIKIVADSISAN